MPNTNWGNTKEKGKHRMSLLPGAAILVSEKSIKSQK